MNFQFGFKPSMITNNFDPHLIVLNQYKEISTRIIKNESTMKTITEPTNTKVL